jgi:pimeloyl-ACP methyl ester carboxylesterase
MSHHLSVIYTRTADDLKLQGMHYQPLQKTDTCVIWIHGTTGNFIENDYADVLGKNLAANQVGFIYGHNRGYGHINDIVRGEPKPDGSYETTRQGAVYERFKKCKEDIDAWVGQAKELGYSKLILAGHSLGGTKVVYWFAHTPTPGIAGLILASPADEVGIAKKWYSAQEYEKMIALAQSLVKQGKYSEMMPGLFEDWFMFSAQTFLDHRPENCPADILPLYNPNKPFVELSKINVPVLCFYGDHAEININSIQEDVHLLKSKATSCTSFKTTILKDANHNYEGQESHLAQIILGWLKKL